MSRSRPFVRAAFALLLCASLLANAVLLWLLHGAFVKIQLGRIFPLDVPAPIAAAPVDEDGRSTLTLAGDSRALLWDTRALASCLRVSNHATGGHSSSQVRLKLEQSPPAAGSVVVLQFGINDLHPLGAFPELSGAILANLAENAQRVTDFLRRRGNPVILTTIVGPATIPPWRRLFWDEHTIEHIARTNDALRSLADGSSVFLLDAAAILDGTGGFVEPRYADPDFFLHLNGAAYAALNAQLALLLERVPGEAKAAACLRAQPATVRTGQDGL